MLIKFNAIERLINIILNFNNIIFTFRCIKELHRIIIRNNYINIIITLLINIAIIIVSNKYLYCFIIYWIFIILKYNHRIYTINRKNSYWNYKNLRFELFNIYLLNIRINIIIKLWSNVRKLHWYIIIINLNLI